MTFKFEKIYMYELNDALVSLSEKNPDRKREVGRESKPRRNTCSMRERDMYRRRDIRTEIQRHTS